MKVWRGVLWMAALGWLMVGCHGAEVRLAVTADTSLQAHEAEVNLNSGASSVIRIKGWQHFLLLEFDLRSVEGSRAGRARLYLHLARPEHALWRVGLSTITSQWREGTGRSEAVDGGCTFLRASAPDLWWAGPGSDFTDVSLGSGGSVVRYAVPREVGDGWLEIDVDPVLVAAMLAGASHGLCVSDEKGQTMFNNDVYSREQSGYQPYLLVEGEPAAGTTGPPITNLRATPYPEGASFDEGAAILAFTAPSPRPVSYILRVRGREGTRTLPQFFLPAPAEPGAGQTIVVPGPPGADCEFALAAIAAWGRPGPEALARCGTSNALARPEALTAPGDGEQPGEVSSAGLVVRAFPGEVKISPVTGQTLEGVPPCRGVGLHAARKEVVAFQLAVGCAGARAPVAVALSDLEDERGTRIPASAGRWYREWAVRDGDQWWAEYAVPLQGPFDLPWRDNGVPGQLWQPLLCDLHVPGDARPGLYHGRVTLAAGGREVPVPVALRVHDALIPDETRFEVDFNCYGPVHSAEDWQGYLHYERLYYRAAHEHRATLNPLPYSQSGRVYEGFAPVLEQVGGQVRPADWAQYDEHYGPYLDGSTFGGYRAGVPITHLYLPLHENWPLPIAEHYGVRIEETSYPAMILAHARLAPPIEQAFDEAFQTAFRDVARAFAEHFRERGWVRSDLQCYVNNKHYYRNPDEGGRGTSWWCLDEPTCTDDFLAVRFFGRLFKEATRDVSPVRMVYRGDISRPQWQRDFLDGLTDLQCVSGALWAYRRRCMDMQRRWGVRFWHYGSPNPVRESNLAAVAWGLRAYLGGAEGILPWNVIGGSNALGTPTETALLVPGERLGVDGPLVSLRVKAFRRAQQDVELLLAVAEKRGWRRTQTAEAVRRTLGGPAGAAEASAGVEGADIAWGRLGPADYQRLREALYAALAG